MSKYLYFVFLLFFWACSMNEPKTEKDLMPKLELLWEDTLSAPASPYPPYYSDGIVYAYSGDDGINAYNANNGQIIWQVVEDIPAVAGNAARIFGDEQRIFATINWELHCFDKKTGDIIWKKKHYVHRVNIVDEINTYMVDYNLEFVALDKYTGVEKWRVALPGNPGRVWDHPAIEADTLYLSVGGYNTWGAQGYLVKLNKQNGNILYAVEVKMPDNPDVVEGPAMPPVLYKNLVIVSSGDYRVYAFDKRDGSLVWTYYHGGSLQYAPIVDGDVAYFAAQDTRAFALNAATGEVIWISNAMNGSCNFGPPAIYDNWLFISSADSYLHCFDKRTGEDILKLENTKAAITVNDTLYAGGYLNYKNFKAYKITPIEKEK